MIKKSIYLFFFLSVLISCDSSYEELRNGFKNPPIESTPRTWWHWINGNVSREGITKDLEEMHNKGIGGVTLFSIWGNGYPKGNVVFGTPQWYELLNHAVKESSRLGMDLGFMNCDGWGTSGGPWITPDDAMKKIVFTKTILTGSINFSDTLPKPTSNKNYYKDIAVFACPVDVGELKIKKSGVKITCSASIENAEKLIDNDFVEYCNIEASDKIENQYVQFQFNKPYAVSSLLLFSVFRYNPINIEIQSSNDGKNFTLVDSFKCKSYLQIQPFNRTSAKYFRIIFKSVKYYVAGYFNKIKLIECALLQDDEAVVGLPLVNQWEIKSALWFNYDSLFAVSDYSKNTSAVAKDKWIDLTSKMDSTGKLNWQVPAGNWQIVRIGYTLTGAENSPASEEGRGLDCDKLDKRGIEASFKGYVAKISENNKTNIGKGLNFVIIDSYEAGSQNWTQILPDEFKKRRGYDLHSWLPVLVGETVNSIEESERFLWDYRRTLADLMTDNYYGHMQTLCHKEGLKFYAEASNPEGTPVCDPLLFSSKTDVPMCEFWANPIPALKLDFKINYGLDGTFKDVISAAHIYNKPIVASESFSCFVGNWQHHPFGLKAQGDLALCKGINRITFHSYAHQPDETVPGWQMNPWGISQNRKATWWEMSSAWFIYLARCQYLLQKGTYVADALVFTNEGAPSTLRKSFQKNPFYILPFGYNYDACNKEILSTAKVKDGKIILENGNHYSLIVLSDEREMSIEFLELLKSFVQQGAVVYGPKPLHTLGLKNYRENEIKFKKLVDELWGNGNNVKEHVFGKGKIMYGISMNETFDKIKIQPDLSFKSTFKNNNIEFIHKKFDNTEIYFISNQSDHPEELICSFRVSGKTPELWHPENGSMQKTAIYFNENNKTIMPLRLEKYGSVFVVFADKAENSIVSVTRNGNSLFPSFNADSTFAATPTLNVVQNKSYQWMFSKSGKYEYITTKGIKKNVDILTMPNDFVIKGPWTVSFEKEHNAPDKIEFDSLIALNKHSVPAIKYYSGISTYTKEIDLSSTFFKNENQLILDLGEMHDMASVKINGQDLGIVWLKPYQVDITKSAKQGKNCIEIKVANSWANRIIGDLALPKEQRVTWSNILYQYSGWGNNKELYSTNSTLAESGLVGPVCIKTMIEKNVH